MPFDRDEAHLVEIADRLRMIERALSGTDEATFLSDEVLQMAVAMALVIIGEAARRLSDDAKSRAPEIDWNAIVGLRNRIAHGYGGLDHRLIWSVIDQQAPALDVAVRRLLAG
jgi:uncharacterized protein with HEPN domain